MAIPKAKVWKSEDGLWNSSVHSADKYGGVAHVIFRTKLFARALRHAFVNAY